MRIFVDIDETICFHGSKENRLGYRNAVPHKENIAKINKLYNEGNQITYYTARGSVSGINWYDITKTQLDEWGCKYHKLITGHKPAYDLIICDKSMRIEEL